MDNNHNNNGQINTPDINQPINQNQNIQDNPPTNYNTYSSVPGVFNNRNAVSQNRNIPPAHKTAQSQVRQPVANNRQVRQPVQNNTASNQPIRNNTQSTNRVSEGRAFAEEFYSQSRQPVSNNKPMPNPQGIQQPIADGRPPMPKPQGMQQPIADGRPPMLNPQGMQQPIVDGRPPMLNSQGMQQPIADGRPPMPNPQGMQQPIVDGRPPMPNSQGRPQSVVEPKIKTQQPVENIKPMSNIQDNLEQNSFNNDIPIKNIPENNPGRNIKYNYNALTPPDKKSTHIIIAVYIVVVLLLLVGIIGYAVTSGGGSGLKESFSEMFSDINFEEIFASDTDDNTTISDSVYQYNITTDNSYNSATLYYVSDDSTEYEVIVSAPYGYEYNEGINENNSVSFFDSSGTVVCDVWITDGGTDNDSELFDEIINPDAEEYTSFESLGNYSTTYGNAVMYKIEFDSRTETFAFINIDNDVIMAVKMSEQSETVDVDDEEILSSIEEILDSAIF